MRTKSTLPMNLMIDNILKVYYQSNIDEKHEGLEWYTMASTYCHGINRMTGLDDYKSVCAIMAALSPNNRWERNISDTHHTIQDWMLGIENTSVGTYGVNRQKALDILEQGAEHIDAILGGNKVKAFYNCIKDAGLTQSVCIDTHAISIALGERYTVESMKGKYFRSPYYGQFVDAYRFSAAKLGYGSYTVSPCQLQAITWLTWRRLHNV